MPNTHETIASLFGDIADAIRAKGGTSESIVADNFPTAISNLPEASGNIDISTTDEYNVADYATARISATERDKIISGNIRSGVTILGVSGSSKVVDTDDGNAKAREIISGKVAYVDGERRVGTLQKTSATFTTNGTFSVPNNETVYNQVIVNVDSPYTSFAGGINNTQGHQNTITFNMVNWAADNELCIALSDTSISSLKLAGPFWNSNDAIGANTNQGGWHSNFFNSGSVRDGVVITARLAADGSFKGSDYRWLLVSFYNNVIYSGSTFNVVKQFCFNSDTPLFNVSGSNTIQLTNNGLVINGTTLSTPILHKYYNNGAWADDTASGTNVNGWVNFIGSFNKNPLNHGYAYIGVAPMVNTSALPTQVPTTTSLCLKNVCFSNTINS